MWLLHNTGKLDQVHNNLINAVVAQTGEIGATTIWQVSGTTKAEGEESAAVFDIAYIDPTNI